MCINKRLKVIDCVEDPRPPHAKNSKPTATAGQQADDATDISSARVPPNYNCNMVLVPKLQQHWGKTPGLDAVQPAEQQDSHSHHKHHSHHAEHYKHKHDDVDNDKEDGEDVYIYEAGSGAAAAATDKAFAELAAAMQPLMESAADAVQELAEDGQDLLEAASDGTALGVSSVAASLAAVEQAAAAVAISVAEAVAASASGTAVEPTSIDLVAQAPVLQQHKDSAGEVLERTAKVAAVAPAVTVVVDKMQQHAVNGPNQHLPLLAAVVVAVVAAAVVAAAVALRAAACAADAKGSCRAGGYVPPGIVGSPEPQKLGEALPLLAAPNTV